ncbi:MAG: hypothetical protein OEO79_11850 [Gemmatimonadota bacterium]|nr:hypothetical protein [Gemmatimonadota bacterium]MDH3421969.1 hypothetical protein [Gemmatimonadota bacterium]
MSDEKKDTRLPPPAFPPGNRKHRHVNSVKPATPAVITNEPGEASFIFPDDPIPPRRDPVGGAFISPDDPMPERRPDAVFDAFISPDDPIPMRQDMDEEEEGVVTGMGSDPHMDPAELVSGGDPHVIELIGAVGRLAEALKRQGEAGLKTSTYMTRFEATLRSYCVGYLVGRRADDGVEIGD